jgi:hypothetical protein
MTEEELALEQQRVSAALMEAATRQRELDHKIQYELGMLEIERRKIELEEFKYGLSRPYRG